MEMIYYELQSSTAVLAVYCNFCGKRCSFCYSWPHYDIAFWTHKKESIMCTKCARNNKEKIYRIECQFLTLFRPKKSNFSPSSTPSNELYNKTKYEV